MNRHLLAPLIGCILLLGATGCERAEKQEEFPQAAADGWMGAFNSGDAEGLALMYSEDSEILPPDQPIVSGYAAIEEFWKNYGPGQVRLAISGVDTRKLGKFWFREGSYSAMFPNEGEPRVGKFMELWTRSGNNWLLYRHMWSPNAPPPAQMPEMAPSG